MTRVDEILKELRKGTPIKKIQSMYPSRAQLYQAYSKYFPEADREIERKQTQSQSLNSQISGRQSQLESLDEQITEHNQQKDKVEKDRNKLEQDLAIIKRGTEEKRNELNEITTKLSELEKIGVTQELLTRIHEMEVESDEALLERAKTAANHTKTQKELDKLIMRKNRVEEEMARLEKTKGDLISDIQTQRNLLDESRRRTRAHEEAVGVVTKLFLDGYTTPDLDSLRQGLNLLGIKGDSTLSIQRLVRGLDDVKTLFGLENSVRESRQELKTLRANIGKARGEFRAMEATVIKAMDKAMVQAIDDLTSTREAGLKNIEATAQEATKSLDKICKDADERTETVLKAGVSEFEGFRGAAEKTLADLGNEVQGSLREVDNIATDIVETLEKRIEKALNEFDNHVSATMKRFGDDSREAQTVLNDLYSSTLEDLSKTKAELELYKDTLATAETLRGWTLNPEALRDINKPQIALLLSVITEWAKMHADVAIKYKLIHLEGMKKIEGLEASEELLKMLGWADEELKQLIFKKLPPRYK